VSKLQMPCCVTLLLPLISVSIPAVRHTLLSLILYLPLSALLPHSDGYVPLGPQSNLQVAFDSSSSAWSLKIASKVAAAKAHVRSAQARAASTAGISTAAAKPSSPVLSARAQNAVVARTQQVFQQAAASTCDGGCGDAPWYPYECVPCPAGYSVDFYGLTCGEQCCWWMASMRYLA
jgi:hypothetical protein